MKRVARVLGRRPWCAAYTHGLLLTAAGIGWLGLRRGTVDLFIANKAIACAGLLLIAAAMAAGLLAGRLHRGAAHLRQWGALLRTVPPRECGHVGAQLTFVHVVVTLGMLPEHFPFPRWFVDHPVETMTGAVAFGLLTVVVYRSIRFRRPRVRTPLVRWLLPVALLHVLWLKLEGWMSWAAAPATWLPPWSLPVSLVAALLTLVVLRGERMRRAR